MNVNEIILSKSFDIVQSQKIQTDHGDWFYRFYLEGPHDKNLLSMIIDVGSVPEPLCEQDIEEVIPYNPVNDPTLPMGPNGNSRID